VVDAGHRKARLTLLPAAWSSTNLQRELHGHIQILEAERDLHILGVPKERECRPKAIAFAGTAVFLYPLRVDGIGQLGAVRRTSHL
jgi:hypothetical protein